MRVIGGEARGLRLKAPSGIALRPTSDLVREAIFNMLGGIAQDWGKVLDLYAGTGALGIEALSRGALWADFVEQNPRCCSIIRENLERTGLEQRGKVYCMDVGQALKILPGPYGIVFMDPPYALSPEKVGLVELMLASSRLTGENTIIVVEHAYGSQLEPGYGEFIRLKERRHGDTLVSLYGRKGGEVVHSHLSREF